MDLSPEEEVKTPLLDNFFRPELKKRIRSLSPFFATAVMISAYILLYSLFMYGIITCPDEIQPEIRLNSVFVCPTIRRSVIWDLEFELINTQNDSQLCIGGGQFKVSIFTGNQTKLLTMAVVRPSGCIRPRNRTPVIGLVEDFSSIQDLNEYMDPTSGTIGLDLKIHNKPGYDLVCGDAKVALSSNSSALSCVSMVGDPFACSYEPHSGTSGLTWLEIFFLSVITVLVGGAIVAHLFVLWYIQSQEHTRSQSQGAQI